MTPDQIKLLKSSYAQVETIADAAADLFYGRLFEVAPAVKPLFKNDMKAQGRMLLSAIGLVVRGLENPEAIMPAVKSMGERHNRYGALPEHYPVVGECLLWTLEQGLGDSFTPELKQAWAEAYELLSGLMIDAQKAAGFAKAS